MGSILVTGFEPFGGDARNPAEQIARALDGRRVGGRRIVAAVLPCAFGAARTELRRLLRAHAPEVIVCVGLARERLEITPERVAINIDDARIPDNAGRRPVDEPIVRGGPAAYWSTLPVKAIVAALQRRRIRARISQTAGTFVCNHVFYALMHALRRQRTVRGGFIHVPWPAEWPGAAAGAMPLDQLVRGIETAVATCVRHRKDVRRAGGAES